MRHLLIKDSHLNGWEYGMLRSFEKAIIQETNADVVEIPDYDFLSSVLPHFSHGMKRGAYRRYFPRQHFNLNADVAWYILMGPENYKLDLFKDWDKNVGKKILYLYDTFPSQYPLIKKLFSNNNWDILITSFGDAVDDLVKLTGRKWYCIEQAVDAELFSPVRYEDRSIQFSSYGRRHPLLHGYLKEFCEYHNLYYDYTTHDGRHPVEESSNLYKQYAWHIKHSLFTFSWPVELTHPFRAGHLHPITCRWFEAIASGTIIAGLPPSNSDFVKYFQRDVIEPIEYGGDRLRTFRRLEELMSGSKDLHLRAMDLSLELYESLTWNNRVQRILSIVNDFE